MNKKTNEIEKLIAAIHGAYTGNLFKNYIEYIRFPFYKNLELESRIDFNFPLTVLVGQNGSGKSSALQGIYGMPEGYSPGNFWFSTKVDTIEDDETNKPCLIYGYKGEDGDIKEVLKTRIGQAKGTHYWEPSRPIKKYGMEILKRGARHPTIKKDVQYLDFRSELSAYDKFFYLSNFNVTKTFKSRQDLIRIKSKHLRETIDSGKEKRHFSRKIEKPIILDADSLNAVNTILGKDYLECKLITHNLYSSVKGLTVYFRTNSINYSEAFAGRGEFAVVRLVYEITSAKPYSLILLDEPEVSLHPGAQEKLLEFLLKQTLEKKLQIVLSTHSPKFVRYLPENAIKLFLPSIGARFQIKNSCHYLEAFQHIGQELSTTNKKVIYVEDNLAKNIFDAILSDLNNELALMFVVNYLPGGAGTLFSKAVAYTQENEHDKFIVLDGDQFKEKVDPSSLTLKESKSITELDKKIKEITGISFKNLGFAIDGQATSGGNEAQKIDYAIKYLNYIFNNLDYFPNRKTPEDLIWDSDYANKFLVIQGKQPPTYSSDNKENIKLFTQTFTGELSFSSHTTCCKILVDEFVRKKNGDYNSILTLLNTFKSKTTK